MRTTSGITSPTAHVRDMSWCRNLSMCLVKSPLPTMRVRDCTALNGWNPALIIASITPSVGTYVYFALMASYGLVANADGARRAISSRVRGLWGRLMKLCILLFLFGAQLGGGFFWGLRWGGAGSLFRACPRPADVS